MGKKFSAVFVMAVLVMGNTWLHGQTISAPEARDLAISVVGGGTVTELQLVSDPVEGTVYRIVVVNNYARYDVVINAGSGDVLRLQPQAEGPAIAAPSGDGETRRVRRNPFRPRVSRAQAVEIGYAFLAYRGFPNASFRRHSGVDFDWGRWSWELYFWDIGVEIELYVDMHTGDVVNFELEGTGRGW